MKPRFLVLALLLAGTAQAETADVTASTFQVKSSYAIKAPAAKVYEAYSQIGNWWNPAHSWSGKGENLSLETKAGGCFCEKLPDGGSVQHMAVVFAQPGKLLRLSGGLGPLQPGALAGSMSWQTVEKDGVTTLSLTYNVSGYYPGGLDKIAPAVDMVLAEQMNRLKKYVETGKPV